MRFHKTGRIFSAGTVVSTDKLIREISRLIRKIPANRYGYKVVASRNYLRVRKQEGFFCPKCGTVYPDDIGLGCLGCQ